MSFACPSCAKIWQKKEYRDQHVADTGHHVFQFNCDTCSRHFKNQEAVDQHMEALRHRKPLDVTLPDSQFGCDTCTRQFKSQEAAGQHMDDLGHRKQLATTASEYILHPRPVRQMTDDPTGYERLVSQICPKYLTPNEANEIRLQFDGVWKENKQVLWSGTDYSKTKEWASQHGLQTLTVCMGPLMETGHTKCRRKSSFRSWTWYMRGASALFAWRISQGRSTTVLTPPPPYQYHPSGMTNYQDIERPILQGVLGVSVAAIMMVHPEVSGAEHFAYEAWPNDQHTSWVAKFGEHLNSDWREVSRKRVPMIWRPIGCARLRSSSEDNCQATRSQIQSEDDELEICQYRNDQHSEIQPKKLQAIEGSQTMNDYSHGFMVLTLRFSSRRKRNSTWCGLTPAPSSSHCPGTSNHTGAGVTISAGRLVVDVKRVSDERRWATCALTTISSNTSPTDTSLCLVPTDTTWERFCDFTSNLGNIAEGDDSLRHTYGVIRFTRFNFYAPFLLDKSYFQRVVIFGRLKFAMATGRLDM
ncbi:formamidopyrimidine-DNA glycosylase [Colletotrichum tofieldiae]|uniref:Formamidopyrimidine-DNA glycosylase n=1 Tax=Colletotrichum tofieldiae TaxID=708197 RepID=A0A166Q6D3_9PEZI|nr:formamidopyrimidine-DNA glycosylase [Colletotrichum tofieldiae]